MANAAETEAGWREDGFRSSSAPSIFGRIGRALRGLSLGGRTLALCLVFAVATIRVEDPTPVQALRYLSFDLFQRIAPRELATDRVLIVDIDEASIAEIGQWPWSRAVIAEMIDALDAGGAEVVGFDIVFSERDRLSPPAFAEAAPGIPDIMRGVLSGLPDTDARLAESIARAPVVLGASAAEWPDPNLERGALRGAAGSLVAFDGDPTPFLFATPGALINIDTLETAANGRGLFSLAPEHDGVVRRAPMAIRIGDQILPALSMEMLRVSSGADTFSTRLDGAGAGLAAVGVGPYTIPTDREGRAWVHFAPYDVDRYISARDLLAGRIPRDRIEGRFVLVGTSAIGLRDLRLTALGEVMPGVDVHAQIIDAALSGDHLTRPSYTEAFEHSLAAAAVLLLLVSAPNLTAARSAMVAFALIASIWAISAHAFIDRGVAVDPTYPSIAALIAFAALAYSAYGRAEVQRRQIRSAFGMYLAPGLVSKLADDPESLSLGGESREMTFLFTDLAGFTSFAEKCDPSVLVELLNGYLDGVCQIVMDHGGAIDKIVGDAVHAMFNAPLDDPEHAANAVRCAMAIEAFAIAYNEKRRAEGHALGETRIGVNSGRAVVGNFGGASRFDYTAHGDAINTAARLESANKHFGTTVCISGATAAQAPGVELRPIGAVVLKGKREGVDVFEPAFQDMDGRAPLDRYLSAYSRMASGAPGALQAFEELEDGYPDDPLVRLHRRRLAAGAADATIVMESK